MAFGGKFGTIIGSECLDDAVPCADTKVGIHLGDLLAQLVGVSLREATDHKELLDLPCIFRLDGAQDHLDRLLLGIADKAAGVDYHHLGIGAITVEDDLIAGRLETRHQVLRIDRILRTTERYDINFSHRRRVH